MDIFSFELNRHFKILNVYGTYADKEAFWNKTLGNNLALDENLVLSGVLNFIVNKDEIWGMQGREDKL